MGVSAFFCISGFVIPYSFGGGPRPGRAFVISRIARLFPAYWCALALIALAHRVAAHESFGAWPLIANATMLQKLFFQPDLIAVSWTLFIEILCYFFCLAAFLSGLLQSALFLTLSSAGLLALAAAAPVAGLSDAAIPCASLSLMFAVSLWRRARLERDESVRRLAPLVIGLWLAGWTLVAYLSFGGEWLHQCLSWYCGLALFFATLRVTAAVPAALIWLGACSYSIYLFHAVVAAAVLRIPGLSGAAPLIRFLVTAVASVAFASLSYSVVEKPAIALGKRMARWPGLTPATLR